jgi:quercetin dioxygenase-like cupin family protein
MARPPVISALNPVAYFADPGESFDMLGPSIQFLTPFEQGETAPCVMRGTVPPGAAVPLHSHENPETFIVISGELEALLRPAENFRWVKIASGRVLHVS